MVHYFLTIDDTVAEASAMLARMRLDGLDRARLPFAERYVQMWRGSPEPDMDSNILEMVFKARGTSAMRWCRSGGAPSCFRRCTREGQV